MTVSVTLAVRETPPLVPVIVSVLVTVLVFGEVETVSVELVPVVELGLNDADVRLGRPLTENETDDVKLNRFTVTV